MKKKKCPNCQSLMVESTFQDQTISGKTGEYICTRFISYSTPRCEKCGYHELQRCGTNICLTECAWFNKDCKVYNGKYRYHPHKVIIVWQRTRT